MKIVSKYKVEILVLLILIISYFILRLPNLTLQPIFADEAIYIRWAQVMKAEPTLRFLPLSDGKTPLFMWAMIPLFKVFEDPLFAGRILSVFSGVFTLLGAFFLSRKVFGKQTAFWATLLYAVTPYTVFFDRMALVDSMLAAFTIWIIYFAIFLVQKMRWDLSMILGYLLGGAVLVKTPGMFNLLILPLSLIAFLKRKNEQYDLIKLVFLWAVSITIALVIYNSLRLGPNFHQLSARNADYIFSPTELIGRPLDPFIPHFRDMIDWFPKLLTWPTLFCIVVGSFYTVVHFNRLGILVLLWAIIPLIFEMAFLKTFTARYLLSSIPPLLIIGGYGIIHLIPRFISLKKISFILMLVVILPLPLYFNYLLVTDPPKAPLPKAERRGYLEDWTAGYGFKEVAQFLLEKKKKEKVVLGTEGFFGTLPDGVQIYLDKAEIPIVGSHATVSAQLRTAAKENSTYFLGNRKNLQNLPELKLVMQFEKAKSLEDNTQDASALYQVLP